MLIDREPSPKLADRLGSHAHYFCTPFDDIEHADPSDQRNGKVARNADYANCVVISLLCKFSVLPDRDDRQFCRHKVLIQNMKRIQATR